MTQRKFWSADASISAESTQKNKGEICDQRKNQTSSSVVSEG